MSTLKQSYLLLERHKSTSRLTVKLLVLNFYSNRLCLTPTTKRISIFRLRRFGQNRSLSKKLTLTVLRPSGDRLRETISVHTGVRMLVNDWKNLAHRVRYSFLTQIGGGADIIPRTSTYYDSRIVLGKVPNDTREAHRQWTRRPAETGCSLEV